MILSEPLNEKEVEELHTAFHKLEKPVDIIPFREVNELREQNEYFRGLLDECTLRIQELEEEVRVLRENCHG